MGRAGRRVAELSVSDYGQIGPLAEYLHLALPDVCVTRSAGRAGRGEQGTLDVLMIAADSTVLVQEADHHSGRLRGRAAGDREVLR